MATRDYDAEIGQLFPNREVRKSEPRYFWVEVSAQELRTVVASVKEKLGITHLSTIVGEDMRDHFLLSYPMSGEVVLVLQVKISREKPEIPSLAPVIDGAIVYERELHDLFGIVPLEHPDLRRQTLPEEWPAGVYPLRKDVVIPRPSLDSAGGEEKNG